MKLIDRSRHLKNKRLLTCNLIDKEEAVCRLGYMNMIIGRLLIMEIILLFARFDCFSRNVPTLL